MTARRSEGRRVLLLGGTSEIGLAIVAELQRQGSRDVVLAGRDPNGLTDAASSLRSSGVEHVSTLELDALDTAGHRDAVERAAAALGGGIDIAIVAAGTLGERGGLPSDARDAVRVLETNAVGAGSLLIEAATHMRDAGGGTIVVLSSVAAERPRRENVVYGAAKACLDALARGFGDALQDENVRVLVVRPGFVRTRMTAGLAPAPLATDAATVARASASCAPYSCAPA